MFACGVASFNFSVKEIFAKHNTGGLGSSLLDIAGHVGVRDDNRRQRVTGRLSFIYFK